jgi:Outer membrane protein beta-barrel domain
MKTRLLFFSLLIIVVTSHGQTIFLKFGPSFSKLIWNNSIVYDEVFDKSIIGFDAIAGINYLNFKYFNLISEAGNIQKGGSKATMGCVSIGNNHEIARNTIRLNFLTINTVFNLKIPIKEWTEPYIFAGPRIDYLLSYSENEDFIKHFDEAKELNKVSYGLILGGGINFKVKRFQLGLVFDYYLTMNKLVNYSITVSTSTGMREVTNKLYDNTFTINALIIPMLNEFAK